MQVFVLLSVLVAAASAGYAASGGGYDQGGYGGGYDQGGAHFQTQIQHDQSYNHQGGYGASHYEHVPIGYDGVPLDTPEVEHAKAEHFRAHQEANNRIHTGLTYKDLPVDTQEVHIAKVAHAQAHAVVKARNANVAIQQAYLHQQQQQQGHQDYQGYHH